MVRFVEFVHLHLEIYITITLVKANREKVLNTNFSIYYCKIVLIRLNNINLEPEAKILQHQKTSGKTVNYNI